VLRVLSIIGILLTVVFLIWLFVAATSNGMIDMDEFAPAAFIYGLFVLALSVIGTIKGGKSKNI
jgi:ABC-type thiamin/hydroxymethylpyrimidine transport system permease subunit